MSIQIKGLQIPVSVIIPAAGSGKRMGGGTAKQFLPLLGEPVLLRTVRLFSDSPLVDEIVLAASDVAATAEIVGHLPKVTRIVQGGAERQDSVWAGLQAVHSRPRLICVHDAARPLLSLETLHGLLQAAAEHPAQVVAVPVKDTIKVAGPDGLVQTTPDRASLWSVQTPQVFWVETLVAAFTQAQAEGFRGTDCASLVERTGAPVRIYPGNPTNLKLTTPEDLLLAEAILQGQEADR
ncbi:MAG TPA: 2-C-methyl-D-erythritol 4-phosphate cytidylyltransferase [Symbiobacteriaceae bacterium]|nr:2-C-methyl-D-erythritol 4-phosphate cytidylyltransferase [Symbiobacteriaceae bacterium]